MSKKVSQPRVFTPGTVVDHPKHGRCVVKYYHPGENRPYDIVSEDDPRSGVHMSYKKDLTLAGPRPPEVYEKWFK